MEHPFRRRLREGKVIVADGAMGTQIYSRGVGFEECFDAQNLDRPQLVEQIHRDYINAGAELIETNTFGANRAKLDLFGLDDRVREINVAGARLARAAREICGEPVFVAGSVGPTGRALEPFGNASPAEVYGMFVEQIAALLEGGVDLLILETFGDVREMVEALRAARAVCDLPVIAQVTFADDLRTPQGYTPEQVVEEVAPQEVDVIGANCSVGSNTLLEVTERLVRAGAPAVSAMPNAGWPTRVANRVMYLSSPEYMAEYGRRMADVGAVIVGGCCGTTPAHIQALKRATQRDQPAARHLEVLPAPDPEPQVAVSQERSDLAARLGTKQVISVELRPPRGANAGKALQGARLLQDAGVDAINVLDSAMARVRMSSIATAVLVQQRVGVGTIIHFTTRDRNLMAIQSDLIGAHALGIRTILALTGDPPTLGDYVQSKPVYDVDSVGLIRIIKQFNQGVDVAGNSIGTPTRFLVGCAFNPVAEDLPFELGRFREKLAAGADFVMTQPVYDAELFTRVLEMAGPIEVPVLMGVLPLQSYRHALFLRNEVPGVAPTDEALGRMERAGTDGIREGLEMAREIIYRCGHLVAGTYIMPSFGRYEAAAQLVSELRETAPVLSAPQTAGADYSS